MTQVLFLILICFETGARSDDAGVFAKALWFLQTFGEPECCQPQEDLHVKNVLAKALANDRRIVLKELDGLISSAEFAKHTHGKNSLGDKEIAQSLNAVVPESRVRLNAELRRHAELLTTSFDMIDRDHIEGIETLSTWIADQWRPESSLHIITTCTGNSRRSILGATMGNLAASFYGFDNIRFHSGGTTPSAFNKRTIATLQEIGFRIEPTGQEATGDPQIPNPIYKVVWGDAMEALEFSKTYNDSSNPQSGFAAILVCSEADAECPVIAGASLRVSMTFIDPKLYDDGFLESKKYAERRDDIGRTLLAAMAIARHKIQAKSVPSK